MTACIKATKKENKWGEFMFQALEADLDAAHTFSPSGSLFLLLIYSLYCGRIFSIIRAHNQGLYWQNAYILTFSLLLD